MTGTVVHPANRNTRKPRLAALDDDDASSASGSAGPRKRTVDAGGGRTEAHLDGRGTTSLASSSKQATAVQGRRGDATAASVASATGAAAGSDLDSSPSRSRTSGKRKREYAWMDSGDEASSAQDAADSDKSSAEHLKDPPRLSEVETLSQMLRLVPQLCRRLLTMPPAELVEAIAAASRVRFYDAEFFEKLLPEIRARLRKRGSAFAARELVNVTVSLQELNAYDAPIFTAIARELKHRVGELDSQHRKRLLTVYKTVNHQNDADFVDALVQRDLQEAEAQQATRQSGDYLVMRSPGQLRPCRM